MDGTRDTFLRRLALRACLRTGLLAICASLFFGTPVAHGQSPANAPPKPDVSTTQTAAPSKAETPATPPAAPSKAETSATQAGATPKADAAAAPVQKDAAAPDLLSRILRAVAIVAGMLTFGFFAWIVFLLVRAFLASMAAGEPIAVHSNWSGFGGGLSGWSLSHSLSLLLAVMVLASFTYGLANAVLRAVTPGAPTETSAPDTTSKADEETDAADDEKADAEAEAKAD